MFYRFVQAICINREINHVNAQNPRTGGYSFSKAGTTAAGNIGRPTTRDLYVQAFSKTLPAITNKLIDHYEKNWDTISNIKGLFLFTLTLSRKVNFIHGGVKNVQDNLNEYVRVSV